MVLVVMNFTPVSRGGYQVGVPRGGWWRELLNSDGREYWGSGVGNAGGAHAVDAPHHGRPWHLNLVLPPMGILLLKAEG